MNFRVRLQKIAIIPYPVVAYFYMDTDGSRHRIVDEFFGQTIHPSQYLLILFSSIVSSSALVATSSLASRTCPVGVA